MFISSYKFRLYPTITQKHRLDDAIETCRNLYNKFVFESRLAYKEGYKLKFDELQRIIPEIVSKENPVYSKVAQMVLWQFYNNLSALSVLSKKNKAGYLRYKLKNRYTSINYNQSGFRLLNNKILKLSKIGKIKIKLHRTITNKIKGIIIKKEAELWYACVIVETPCKSSCSLIRQKIIGIDVGVINFVYDSDGIVISNPRYLKNSEKKLKKIQRNFSKKTKDSTNSYKQKLKLAKIHQKIKNQRNDFLHKISRYYVNNYDTIFVEDLKIDNMLKNHRIAKSISDSAWYSFFQKLEYKAERAGILFQKIAASGTSQKCSRCNKIVHKILAIRTHICSFCGLVMDRDHNAAVNIKQKGMSRLPMVCRKVTPVEIVPLLVMRDNKQEQSLNQEAHDLSNG